MSDLGQAQLLNAQASASTASAQAAAKKVQEPDAKSMAAVDKSAHDFEAMFLSQMLQPMWSGIETNEMFGGGHGEEMFRGMLVSEYGKLAAKSGNLGIADEVKAEMLRIQEKANAGKPTMGGAATGKGQNVQKEDGNGIS